MNPLLLALFLQVATPCPCPTPPPPPVADNCPVLTNIIESSPNNTRPAGQDVILRVLTNNGTGNLAGGSLPPDCRKKLKIEWNVTSPQGNAIVTPWPPNGQWASFPTPADLTCSSQVTYEPTVTVTQKTNINGTTVVLSADWTYRPLTVPNPCK